MEAVKAEKLSPLLQMTSAFYRRLWPIVYNITQRGIRGQIQLILLQGERQTNILEASL